MRPYPRPYNSGLGGKGRKMTQRKDRNAWHRGHKDGWTGRPSQCPNGTDPLAYASGFAAGRTTRERGIAGRRLLNDGTVNVVEKGSPLLPDARHELAFSIE
jgi:hypothetical protein